MLILKCKTNISSFHAHIISHINTLHILYFISKYVVSSQTVGVDRVMLSCSEKLIYTSSVFPQVIVSWFIILLVFKGCCSM